MSKFDGLNVVKVIHKFGANSAIGGSEEHVWGAGGDYTGFFTTAQSVRVKAGGNAADTAAGAGARTVKVFGLDANYELAEDTLTLAGTSASASSSVQFTRVYRSRVETTGTYGASNTGAIDIEGVSASAVCSHINAGYGQSTQSHFTIPVGYVGFLTRVVIVADPSNTAEVFLRIRAGADVTSAPFTPSRAGSVWYNIGGVASVDYDSPVRLPEKTDIYFTATKKSGAGDTSVAINYDVYLCN